jgi:hypothetical protein
VIKMRRGKHDTRCPYLSDLLQIRPASDAPPPVAPRLPSRIVPSLVTHEILEEYREVWIFQPTFRGNHSEHKRNLIIVFYLHPCGLEELIKRRTCYSNFRLWRRLLTEAAVRHGQPTATRAAHGPAPSSFAGREPLPKYAYRQRRAIPLTTG